MNIKGYIKYIVTIVVMVIVLSASAIITVLEQNNINNKQNSFKGTNFDYITISPSIEQVAEFRANQAVNKVFPCINMETNVIGKKSPILNILLSDDLTDYDISLFNDNLKVQGDFSEDGIMLDKKAAAKLGVGVGSEVKIILKSHEFTLKVVSIYSTSTYRGLDNGLCLMRFTDEMKALYEFVPPYNLAFIDAKDNVKCEEMLLGYKPLGQLISEEKYIKNIMSEENCPPNMTEEEWINSIKVSYKEYKDEFLKDKYSGVVQKKQDFMDDVIDQVDTTQEKINKIILGVAIASIVIYTAMIIIFTYRKADDDFSGFKDGITKRYIISRELFVNIFVTITISMISTLAILVVLHIMDIAVDMQILAKFCLPVLLSLILIIPFSIKYANDITYIYESENKKNKEHEISNSKM